jgi:hypothetical protein
MKTKNYINTAFLMVALVFGFAACSYDNELQPPKKSTGLIVEDENSTGRFITQPDVLPVARVSIK